MHAQMIGWWVCCIHIVDFDHPTVVHASDTVGVVENAVVMGDNEHGAVLTAGDMLEELHDNMTVMGVQSSGRFIADDQAWLMHERTGDCDTLLLAARKL